MSKEQSMSIGDLHTPLAAADADATRIGSDAPDPGVPTKAVSAGTSDVPVSHQDGVADTAGDIEYASWFAERGEGAGA